MFLHQVLALLHLYAGSVYVCGHLVDAEACLDWLSQVPPKHMEPCSLSQKKDWTWILTLDTMNAIRLDILVFFTFDLFLCFGEHSASFRPLVQRASWKVWDTTEQRREKLHLISQLVFYLISGNKLVFPLVQQNSRAHSSAHHWCTETPSGISTSLILPQTTFLSSWRRSFWS